MPCPSRRGATRCWRPGRGRAGSGAEGASRPGGSRLSGRWTVSAGRRRGQTFLLRAAVPLPAGTAAVDGRVATWRSAGAIAIVVVAVVCEEEEEEEAGLAGLPAACAGSGGLGATAAAGKGTPAMRCAGRAVGWLRSSHRWIVEVRGTRAKLWRANERKKKNMRL